jgi:hypothetical protein
LITNFRCRILHHDSFFIFCYCHHHVPFNFHPIWSQPSVAQQLHCSKIIKGKVKISFEDLLLQSFPSSTWIPHDRSVFSLALACQGNIVSRFACCSSFLCLIDFWSYFFWRRFKLLKAFLTYCTSSLSQEVWILKSAINCLPVFKTTCQPHVGCLASSRLAFPGAQNLSSVSSYHVQSN